MVFLIVIACGMFVHLLLLLLFLFFYLFIYFFFENFSVEVCIVKVRIICPVYEGTDTAHKAFFLLYKCSKMYILGLAGT